MKQEITESQKLSAVIVCSFAALALGLMLWVLITFGPAKIVLGAKVLTVALGAPIGVVALILGIFCVGGHLMLKRRC